MRYDLKIILKKSKPVLWYELEVPGGVTFSALSVFLDIASGTKDAPPSDYIFDLPSFEVQLREGIFEDGSNPLYKQALREADTTFIDEYMKKDSWFTYKPDKNEDAAFRIEVKGISSKMQVFPFPRRYSRGAWELFEKDDRSAFKDKMKELMCYLIQYDEGFRFVKKKDLLDERGKKKFLSGGSVPIELDSYVTVSREEMVEAIQALSDFDTLCTVHDGRIVYHGWLHDDEYKALESYQGDKAYYIPTKKEVEDISWNGYPSQQWEVKTLFAFLQKEMEMEEIDAEDLRI